MAHDRESRDLATEKMVKDMSGLLDGIGGFVATVEGIVTSLHLIAKGVKSMEEDGSLPMLLELLKKAEQNPTSLLGSLRDEKRIQED